MSKGNEPGYPSDCVVEDEQENRYVPLGLSKREYFAGLAMQSILSGTLTNTDVMAASEKLAKDAGIDDYQYLSAHAARYADALLAELEKTA